MAIYKNGKHLKELDDVAFDKVHSPANLFLIPASIAAMVAGVRLSQKKLRRFPPQKHHQHTAGQGTIRWRLLVYADHEPK